MSSFSLSVENFNTDLNYLDGQAHYALESMPSLGLESADPDQGLLARLTEKVKVFFRWLGELVVRFVKWVTGQTAEEKEIHARLDRMVKAGAGGKGEITQAEAIKNALRPQLQQLAAAKDGQAKISEALEDVKASQRAVDRASLAAERLMRAKDAMVSMLNHKSEQLLFVRMSMDGNQAAWGTLNIFFHQIFHGLASYEAREVARHSDEAGVLKAIQGYLKEYEDVKRRLGYAKEPKWTLANIVRVNFSELERAIPTDFHPEYLDEVLTAVTGNRNYFGDSDDLNKAAKEMAENSLNLEKHLSKIVPTAGGELAALLPSFLSAYRDSVVAASVFTTQALGSFMVGREFARDYYKAWDDLNTLYETHKASPNKYDQLMVVSLHQMVPSLGR